MQHITYYERQIIEVKLRQDKSKRAIARHLGRDHRVVAREINRNSGGGAALYGHLSPADFRPARTATYQKEAGKRCGFKKPRDERAS